MLFRSSTFPPNGDSEILLECLQQLLQSIGVSAPAALLAEYAGVSLHRPVAEQEVASLLRFAPSVRESSPGMFTHSPDSQAAAPSIAQDVSSGAMIGRLLLECPPLPEGEQVAKLKQLSALRILGDFTSLAEAASTG